MNLKTLSSNEHTHTHTMQRLHFGLKIRRQVANKICLEQRTTIQIRCCITLSCFITHSLSATSSTRMRLHQLNSHSANGNAKSTDLQKQFDINDTGSVMQLCSRSSDNSPPEPTKSENYHTVFIFDGKCMLFACNPSSDSPFFLLGFSLLLSQPP